MVKAYAPANISCVFVICYNKNPLKMHSLGFGFTINKGVIVTVKENEKNIIEVNGKRINLPPVMYVMKTLATTKMKIEIKTPLPLGMGFGLSGASSLATAYALNEFFSLNKAKKELALLAHRAEVICKTGLGDVVNQFYGGFLLKSRSGEPFKVKRINIQEKVYYRCFSKMLTKSVIADKEKQRKINAAGQKALKKIKKLTTFSNFIEIAYRFAIESGLMTNKKVITTIETIKKLGGNASMIMLGNAVYADKPFPNCQEAEISEQGACLL